MTAVTTSGPTEAEIRDAAWLIVKDSRGMEATGHAAAVRWARAYLDLDDAAVGSVRRRKHVGHAHGWAKVAGEWVCAQDYYAVGDSPMTGCGETWAVA